MSDRLEALEILRVGTAGGEGRVLLPRGCNGEFMLSAHAQDRAHERGARRCVLMAALSRRPVSRLSGGVAVFSSDGFQILVDLDTHVVITVLPKDGVLLNAKRRDSGCAAHRSRQPTARRVA
jgi:hypothetical protein